NTTAQSQVSGFIQNYFFPMIHTSDNKPFSSGPEHLTPAKRCQIKSYRMLNLKNMRKTGATLHIFSIIIAIFASINSSTLYHIPPTHRYDTRKADISHRFADKLCVRLIPD
ncbi:hypothetical protein, partial [uncultured Duncaniella sp.]|uniref:hypothetical protein n=1 Tax=uncultured Duncaniella sp. TaxID=2768039 RepID=UPI0025B754FC